MGTPAGDPANDPRPGRRAALRKATLQLVMGVLLLDAVALSVFYGAEIAHAPSRTRMTFVVVWTIATAMVVAMLLRRVRMVRLGR